uniref:Uncharacterized protein n=1 Tax=Aegilops tauschii subsp. strangulata TaxID=200361 RepID=A0A453RFM5_AEGTS
VGHPPPPATTTSRIPSCAVLPSVRRRKTKKTKTSNGDRPPSTPLLFPSSGSPVVITTKDQRSGQGARGALRVEGQRRRQRRVRGQRWVRLLCREDALHLCLPPPRLPGVQRVWNRWRTTAKSLKPKFNLFVKQVSASIGMAEPHIDIKSSIAFTVFLKAFGGLLFIIISSFGAFILVSTRIGMAVPHIDIKSVIAFTMFLKAFGGLLFIISSSFGAVVLAYSSCACTISRIMLC